jgi:hypothetical protein
VEYFTLALGYFMLTKVALVIVTAPLLVLACSSPAGGGDAGSKGDTGAREGGSDTGGIAGASGVGGTGGEEVLDGGSDAAGTTCTPGSDNALIVPPGLDVSLEPGGAGVLDLFALTLQEGPTGIDLYAALRNDGDVPACDAALKVSLYDTTGQPIGDFISGLYTNHFYLYTLPDGSTTIAACASPGDVTMTQISTMAADISVADVGQVVYYYSYFALDAVLINGLTVGTLNTVTTSTGTSYTGTVINNLDMPVSGPSVTVFPLNCVGRPLGITSGSDTTQVPAGGSWSFQTDTVEVFGVNYAAFPSASFSGN